MILILDIDETLIHSRKGILSDVFHRHGDIKQSDLFSVFNYVVQKRPYLDMFIQKVMNDPYFEVGIWSAGTSDYVYSIVNHIIPDKKKLKFIMTSDDCNELRDKPLSKVRDLVQEMDEEINSRLSMPEPIYSRTVHDFLIIDDRTKVTGHDELNHLQILEFEGETDDTELIRLWQYLDKNRYYSSEYLASHWQ